MSSSPKLGVEFTKIMYVVDFKFVSELLVRRIGTNSWKRGLNLEAAANFLNDTVFSQHSLYFGE